MIDVAMITVEDERDYDEVNNNVDISDNNVVDDNFGDKFDLVADSYDSEEFDEDM